MNALDRFVGFFSPVAGLRRASARITLDQVRNYDGAMNGRRTNSWRSSNASANVAIKGALPMLRARSRDLTRNTWWGARVKSVVVGHAVGVGIMPKPNTGDKALDRQVKQAWKKWASARHCDAEGQLGFNGLTALAAGCVVEAGESLARLIVKDVRKPGVVPLEIQLLEPDHLDGARDRVMSREAIVDQGIEYNAEGIRRAWSIKFTILAGFLTAIEFLFAAFVDNPPMPRGTFAGLGFLATLSAFIARFVAQKRELSE